MVHYGRRSRPSALALKQKLAENGYNGRSINFGLGVDPNALNSPQAIENACNKRLALETLEDNNVPVPKSLTHGRMLYDAREMGITWDYPIVGRPDRHRQGRGFWLCHNIADVQRALRGTRRKARATHFMEYIDADREFRVHVVNGKSIKISEKTGGGNHRNGGIFTYPHDFHHKITLRQAAKDAVETLGLDFGAVDILWKDQPYVLEVNTAPCLTDEHSDTLERYAQAFEENYGNTNSVAIHSRDMEDVSDSDYLWDDSSDDDN